MTLFLFFLIASLGVGWLVRNEPADRRFILALAAAIALTAIYFTLERFI
jgi:hypothetical protein